MSPARKPADLSDPANHLPLTNLAFHILLALADGPRHGYAVIRDIEDRTDHGMRVRSGTLYAAIQRLEGDGLLEQEGDGPASDEDDQRRRYYRLTPVGRAAARLEADRLAGLLATAQEKNLIDLRGKWAS